MSRKSAYRLSTVGGGIAVQALGLLALSSTIRALGAFAAMLLAWGFGVSPAMDDYAVFTLAVAAASAMAAASVPMVLNSWTLKFGEAIGYSRARACALALSIGAASLYAAGCLGIALLTSQGFEEALISWSFFALGCIPVGLAPLTALEQSVLQQHRHAYLAMSGSALAMASALGGAAIGWSVNSVTVAAVGIAAGSIGELLWLRTFRHAKRPVLSDCCKIASSGVIEPIPWVQVATFTFAASGGLLCVWLDLILLMPLPPGSQAVWSLANKVPSFVAMGLVAVLTSWLPAVLLQPETERATALRHLTAGSLAASVVAMCAVFCLAVPLTGFLFERGSFSPQDARATADATELAIWAYVLYPTATVLIRAVGAKNEFRLLLQALAISLVVKAFTGVLLLSDFGLASLAVSTFAATAAQCVALLYGRTKIARTNSASDVSLPSSR